MARPRRPDLVAVLRSTPLFDHVRQKAPLERLARQARWREVEVGHAVLHEGAPIDAVHIILHGEVSVRFGGATVESLRLGRGSLFGEFEFLTETAGTATVVAAAPTQLLSLDHAHLRATVAAEPRVGVALYQGLLRTLVGKMLLVTDSLVQWKLDKSGAHLAHDLRAPLATLRSLTAADQHLPPAERALFSLVVERLDGIVGALAGANPAPRGASPTLRALAALVEEKRRHPGARGALKLELLAAGQVEDSIDASLLPHLVRLVANLIDNALEARVPGRPGHVRIRVSRHRDTLRIDVEDDGRGMRPDLLAELGKRPVSRGKADGHGLGLFHAFAVARAWGGALTVYANEGQGTLVSLEIPAGLAPSQAHASPVHRQAVAGGSLGPGEPFRSPC